MRIAINELIKQHSMTKVINSGAKMNFLNNFPIFDGVEVEVKEQVASVMEARSISRYGYVYEMGDESNEVFFLVKGALKIGAHSTDGKEVIKDLIHPTAMFGEMGLVGQTHRVNYAQVLKGEVQIFAVKVDKLRQLMQDDFKLCSNIMNLLGGRLMNTESKLEAVIFKDARARIVDFIKESMIKRGRQVGMEMLLKHSLTHQDIANITCTSRQTVTLVLNELKKSNLIYFNRGKILVRNMDLLQ